MKIIETFLYPPGNLLPFQSSRIVFLFREPGVRCADSKAYPPVLTEHDPSLDIGVIGEDTDTGSYFLLMDLEDLQRQH